MEGQVACACSYLLLQHILKELFDIVDSSEFSYNEHGKPSFINLPDIFFSMSHCKGAVACAVAREPVGIDIENLRHPKPDVLDYVCNGEEMAMVLDSIDPAGKFTELWTRKEAYVKLTGEGITHRVRDLLTDCHATIKTFRVDGRVVSVAHYK